MATQQIPSNLYSGYAQVVDTRPSLNFAARLYAQREAKNAALDKYFQDASSKVTTTGMREAEVKPLMQARDNFNKLWIQNKAALGKGDPDAWLKVKEAQNLMQSIPEASKGEKGKSDLILSARINNPERFNQIDEQKGIPLLAAHEEPTHIISDNGEVVENPNHVSLDPTQLIYNPKEYEGKDWDAHTFKMNQFFKPDKLVTDSRRNPNDPYRQIDVTTAQYSKDKLNAVADWNMQKYAADERLRYTFNKSHDLLNTPVDKWELDHMDEYDRLNNIYKSVKGKDIDTPDELFAATQLETLNKPTITEKSVSDYAAKEAHKDADWFKRYKFRLDHPLPNSALFLSENTGNAFDAITDADFAGRNLIIKGGVFYNRDGTPKTGKVFITGDKIPATVKSALKSGGTDPDLLIKGVDGEVENGVLQNISNKYIGTVPRGDMEGVFQRKLDTEPLKGQRLRFADKKDTPPSKNAKRRSLDSFIKQ